MTVQPVIIVASAVPALTIALRASAPELEVMEASAISSGFDAEGPVRCFVDWLLPDTSGLEMCRRLRGSSATMDAHITLALDEDTDEARRRAMRSGADDYMIGPLAVEHLLARLGEYRAARMTETPPERAKEGGLTLDLAAHGFRWRGRLIALAPNEFRLLAHFLDNPDRLFTRAQLIAVLGKGDEVTDERTVDVWIGRLRRALRKHGGPDVVRTVRSLGYVMDSASARAS